MENLSIDRARSDRNWGYPRESNPWKSHSRRIRQKWKVCETMEKDPSTDGCRGRGRGNGQTIERRTHTANGITARMAVGRQWRAASKTRIERRDKPNKTEPSLESTKPNPSKERERWRGGSEGLAKRQTYLIQVGWSQWRQEEAGARRGEKRIEGRVWYSLDGPRKKIYLASLFDVGALFNYSGRKTWRERLFNQRFERVEAESSAPRVKERKTEGGGGGKGQYLAAGSINSGPDFRCGSFLERLTIRKRLENSLEVWSFNRL